MFAAAPFALTVGSGSDAGIAQKEEVYLLVNGKGSAKAGSDMVTMTSDVAVSAAVQ